MVHIFYMHQVPIVFDYCTIYITKSTHSFLWNIAIITQTWHRTKYYFTSMSNRITTFFSEISQQKLKIYEKIAIITQSWHRAKFNFTCISGPWYLIMVPNMLKIKPAIMEECARTARQTDWTMVYIPRFHLGGVGNNNIFTQTYHLKSGHVNFKGSENMHL